MTKQELRSLIKEEISKVLKEAKAETFTFSGVKSFMSFKAIPVFKKHGIDVTKIKKSYDPDSGTTEITVSMDAKTAEKIGRELEKLDTVGERYGGYIQESKLQERRIPFKGKTTNDLYNIVKADANAMVFANGNHYSVDAEDMRNDLRNPSIIVTDEDGEEFEIKVSDIEFIELNERVVKESTKNVRSIYRTRFK